MGHASRSVALVAIAVAGCSYSYTPKQPTTQVASRAQCGTNTRALADTVIGAGAVGLGLGVGLVSFDEGGVAAIAASVGLVTAGIVYLASANHGFSEYRQCNETLLARAAAEPEPLHVVNSVPANRSCQQRRLDMYSQAVTGADPDQRTRLLETLPVCPPHISATDAERTRIKNQERAWLLTKTAALDAGAGKCDEIESIAREVYDIDISLHDVVFLADIEIKFCLSRREL